MVVPRLDNVQDLYPNVTTVGGSAVFNPLATWVNSAENTQNPKSQYYSVTVQREISDFVMEVGYTGSRGSHGINQIEMNPAVLSADQAALVRTALSSTAIPNVQARRLFPQYGSRLLIPTDTGSNGVNMNSKSQYNAMFVSLNKRFSRGLQFGGSYTYGRMYSNNDASLGEGGTGQSSQRPQNDTNYAVEWSRSAFDRPHRFTASIIWEIPGPKSGVLGAILGGWQITGVTQGQSGTPFTVFTGVDSNGNGTAGSDRPNINSSGTFTWDSKHSSFTNNGRYVVPLGTNNLPLANSLGDGTAPRNSERGAPFYNTDLSLMKRFRTGRHALMVRLDAFNALNQDSYGVPVISMSSLSFGQNTNNWGRRTVQLSGKFTW